MVPPARRRFQFWYQGPKLLHYLAMTAVLDPQRWEARTQAIGRELFQLAKGQHAHLTALNRWAKQVMAWCLGDRQVKASVLRFVDVLPTLSTPRGLARHLCEYFPTSDLRLPPALRLGVAATQPALFSSRAIAAVVHHLVTQMAQQFIAGATVEDALRAIERLEAQGCGFSLDLLGECVTSDAQADAYTERYLALLRDVDAACRRRPCHVPLYDVSPRVNLSIKPSALCAKFDPIAPEPSVEAAWRRLRPIAQQALQQDACIHLDAEQYELRDVTLQLAQRVLDEPQRPHLGVVLQAYLRDAEATLTRLLAWLDEHHRTLTVRLVKGAYWDAEATVARQRGWSEPVYTQKAESDACFERMTLTLLARHDRVRTAIASHNVRSIAQAMAAAELLGVPSERIEFQLLYGMADPLKAAIVARGHAVRVYAPYGELIPGMAYLVRRILENTANESFLRQDFWQGLSEEDLLKPPTVPPATTAASRDETFHPEPVRDFSDAATRERMHHALQQVRAGVLGQAYPLIIAGKRLEPGNWITSINPARPSEIIGGVARGTALHVDIAVQAALVAQPRWAAAQAAARAACLQRAAAALRHERDAFAALEVFEVGKTWREADADVCEAIDFLDYYAQQMLRLDAGAPLSQVPGETNRLVYVPRGIAAIIAPWNFPLAIVTGMTAAALVTGNAAIVKPASQSSVLAAQLVRLLYAAGVPDGVLHFLPGTGAELGWALASHPQVHAILFTGSREVGLRLVHMAGRVPPGQRHVKQVIAEMGGKNAIIVDDDADLDAAVPGILASAFGYQGQKCSACSRVIVLDGMYERLAQRLAEAARSLVIAPPEDPRCDIGPLIDEHAMQRVQGYIEVGLGAATVLYHPPREALPKEGYFVGPAIFGDVNPKSRLAQEEIFGPVLCLLRAKDFTQALAIANDVDYALTGGLYSRSPAHIEQAAREFQVGNCYINRKITGAVVGRQPFGGFKLSGLGTKAGGPDYLLSLLLAKTITENTTRHGMPLD